MAAARTSVLGFCLLGALAWAAASAGQSIAPPQPNKPFPTTATLGVGNPVYGRHDRAQELARQLAKATKEDEKQSIHKELSDVLSAQFDQRTRQQQKELDDLEKQIADLKATLKKRADAKSKIVERRIEQLVQEAEGLGWNTGPLPTPKGVWTNHPPGPPTPAPTATPAKK